MKKVWFLWGVCTLLLGGLFSPASGQGLPGAPINPGANSYVVEVREDTVGGTFLNGKISVNGGPFTQLPDSLIPDPLNNNTLVPSVLLPYQFVQGDLVLTEPGATPPDNVSDLIRFHGQFLCFYSDGTPPETTAFMDINPPAVHQANAISFPEVGVEGGNGFVHITPNAKYIIISDVPESPSLLLFGAGVLGPLACAWRRRKKAA